MHENLHVVVIAGGLGTRFWPLSRRRLPKQLLTLGGDESLLAATFSRLQPLVEPARWWMVVSRDQLDASRAAAPLVPEEQALAEPCGRNTAPAICLSALYLKDRDPDAVMVILPADHHVADHKKLSEAITKAAAAATDGVIVTLGITPTAPATGYGYIERGEADAEIPGVLTVKRFVEKPDHEQAERMLAAGTYDWNAGIFVARASTILAETARQLPAIYEALREAHAAPKGGEALREAYASMASASFDYGIMEHAEQVRVVPVECGWSDVGSFDQLEAIFGRDEDQNVKQGKVIAIDSRGCVLRAGPGQVLATVGLRDVAVIQTGDATLVVAKDRLQDIREVVSRLGEQGCEEFL